MSSPKCPPFSWLSYLLMSSPSSPTSSLTCLSYLLMSYPMSSSSSLTKSREIWSFPSSSMSSLRFQPKILSIYKAYVLHSSAENDRKLHLSAIHLCYHFLTNLQSCHIGLNAIHTYCNEKYRSIVKII